jgi:hypothetical protein
MNPLLKDAALLKRIRQARTDDKKGRHTIVG